MDGTKILVLGYKAEPLRLWTLPLAVNPIIPAKTMTESSDGDHLLMVLPYILFHILLLPIVIHFVQHYRLKVGSLRRVSLFQDARFDAVASTSVNNKASLTATTNQCIEHVGSLRRASLFKENRLVECVIAVASASECFKYVNSLTSRLETKADKDPPFVLCDFIVPTVLEYCGVRSLVRFGVTSKSHRDVALNEVVRRRKVVALIEEDVSNLIGSTHEVMNSEDLNSVRYNIPRDNVNKARALVHTAMRLIDDEIGIIENHPEMEQYCCGSWEEDYEWKDTDVFYLERRKFLPLIHSKDVIGPMYVFPDCFYFSTQGEISEVSQDDFQKAARQAKSLLDAIKDFAEDGQDDDGSLDQLIEVCAFNLTKDGIIDAFRVAARSISYIIPSVAPNPLWHVLEFADEFAAFCDKTQIHE